MLLKHLHPIPRLDVGLVAPLATAYAKPPAVPIEKVLQRLMPHIAPASMRTLISKPNCEGYFRVTGT
jgi:hypothetical protein